MPTSIRKTKNYYRQEVQRSKSAAFACLPEIIKKYGTATRYPKRRPNYYINSDNDVGGYSWWIRGFSMYNGRVSIHVYWQSDNTDGDEYLEFTGNTRESVKLPPSEPVCLNGRYYVSRPGIILSTNDIWEAIKGIKI